MQYFTTMVARTEGLISMCIIALSRYATHSLICSFSHSVIVTDTDFDTDSLSTIRANEHQSVSFSFDKMSDDSEHRTVFNIFNSAHLLTHILTHPFTHSPTHSLIYSLTHSLTHPFTHSPTHSLIYSLTHLLTHQLTHSFTHPFTHPFIHSPTHSPIYSLTHPLTHPFTHSLTHSPIYSLIYSLIHLLIHSFASTLALKCFILWLLEWSNELCFVPGSASRPVLRIFSL